jgi:hypothetical protein
VNRKTGRHVDIQISRQAHKPTGNREAKRYSDMPYCAGTNETTDKQTGKQTRRHEEKKAGRKEYRQAD